MATPRDVPSVSTGSVLHQAALETQPCSLCGGRKHISKIHGDQCRLFTAILGPDWTSRQPKKQKLTINKRILQEEGLEHHFKKLKVASDSIDTNSMNCSSSEDNFGNDERKDRRKPSWLKLAMAKN